MAKHRLINCDFVNAQSFKGSLSNKAKLLYLYMFLNADDKGFVDITQEIIDSLKRNDNEFEKTINMSLLENTYETALSELLDRGLIYVFVDNHNNKIHLIRHWFLHNQLKKGLWTNYYNLLEKVYIDNNEYILGKKPLKEDKLKENNINEIKEDKVNIEPNLNDISDEEFSNLSLEEMKKYMP